YDAHQEVVQNYDQFGPDKNGTFTNDQGEEVTISFMEQAGSMLIDNRSGAILSFVGGRDFERSQYNFATQGKRSTGSTMK
ncbi:hypothetical protein, partial [Pseudomonas sp. 2995-1]|uniref:hypothetical protein n=1 Tax=Pseudomonas sp. 2995-1 TaxID=1712679 RepID=UPI0013040631